MAVRPILRIGDPRLRQVSEPVDEFDTPELHQLIEDMFDTMAAADGAGLAAPQIGVGLRLAVVDGEPDKRRPLRLANPEVLSASAEVAEGEEASPCLPGVSARIERPAPVTVRFLNAEGEVEERAFDGLWATSVQHQIDHLDGKMYFDHLSKLKRDRLIAKSRKLNR